MRQTKQFTGHSLLAVTAHPDDEAILCGGLLAWCADLGARVSLLCLTKGEHGQGKPSVVTGRELELNAAAKLLGIHATTILAHEDGMLPWIDPERLENDIATIIKQAKPDVVITFDSDGVYGHPDHIAVHERTTTVVNQIQASPPARYYASIPSGTMRTLVEHVLDLESGDRQGYFGKEEGVPIIVPAGSVAVFTSVSFHRSGVNTSDRRRRAYVTQYSPEIILSPDTNTPLHLAEPFLEDGRKLRCS